MEKEGNEERTVKRSIRIPYRLYKELVEDSKNVGRSSNQVILDILRGGLWGRGKGKETRQTLV